MYILQTVGIGLKSSQDSFMDLSVCTMKGTSVRTNPI